MSGQPRSGLWPQAAILGLFTGALFVLPTSAAEPAPPDALIRAQLEAGEFAPAMAAARRATPAKRDTWLAQIAVSQAQAGALDASLHTAGEIYDDRTRADSLSSISAAPLGAPGGASMADYQTLIDLIKTTVEPDTWDDVGGPGSIAEFPTGVYVDPQGVLRPLVRQDQTGRLADLRRSSAAKAHRENVRQSSPLRKVSLTRLERHVQLRLAAGRQPTEAMRVLAGLERIQYVFVYPESRDIVLAGPAGNWYADAENRVVSTESGRPLVRLDDLVVILRHMTVSSEPRFGCLITPRQEALARVKTFLARPVSLTGSARRRQWLEALRSTLGTQDVEVYGLDPRTHAARTMVEADYRMKLVGMGLEEGVPGVKSYLDLIKVSPRQGPPPMGVLRWWFTLNYDAVVATEDHQAFAVRGQGVKVLSENELLTAQGKRVHIGASEPLNRQFAQSFTEHFDELCQKYPVYAELRNLCDLGLVAALIRQEDLAGRVGWHMTCFGDPRACPVELAPAPKTVETVANCRVIRTPRQIHTIAGVSGGVSINPVSLVSPGAVETDRDGELSEGLSAAAPERPPLEAWWWD